MKKPRFYMSDEYAGLDTDGAKFYYGAGVVRCLECGRIAYEKCGLHPEAKVEWCFTADIEGYDRIVIPFSELGADDEHDCVDCCTMGIGLMLMRFRLVERPKQHDIKTTWVTDHWR